jgi:dihydrofolate reductase
MSFASPADLAGRTRTNPEEIMMRKIVAWLFVTLDGVMESPEKWVMYNNEMGEAIDGEAAGADTLLLGRRTYEVFAASWPSRTSDDDPMTDWMNNTPKVVVSTTLDNVEWQNSTLISGDLAQELDRLKQQPGRNILVNGSATLVRSLLRDNQLDQLRLFLHPIIAGTGKRLFDNSSDKTTLKLVDSRTLDTGVLDLTYTPADR